MPKFLILFVLGSLFVLTCFTQKSLTVSCYSCGSKCQSGYCFNLTGDGLTEALCPPANYACPGGSISTFTLASCSIDFETLACSSKLCYYLPERQIAWLGAQSSNCQTQTTRNVSCSACSTFGCSTKLCKTVFIDGNQVSNQCVASCPTPASVNQTVKACTGGYDILASSSPCCYIFSGVAGPVCTTQSTILTSSSKIPSWMGATTTFQFHVLKAVLLIFYIGLMMI